MVVQSSLQDLRVGRARRVQGRLDRGTQGARFLVPVQRFERVDERDLEFEHARIAGRIRRVAYRKRLAQQRFGLVGAAECKLGARAREQRRAERISVGREQ